MRLLADGARTAADVQQRLVGTMGAMADTGSDGRTVQDQVTRYWYGVATSTAAYYRELSRAMAGAVDRDDRSDPTSSGEARGGRDRHARIDLQGQVGSSVAATFTVENSDPDPATVSLVPGPCRTPGHDPFAAPASITPPTATIPAGGAVEVTVQVDLDLDLFMPGRTYVLPVRVDGHRPTTVDVAIAVADAPEPDGPPFHVACPACERTFERTTDDLRLRPHKTPDGDDCAERSGRRVPSRRRTRVAGPGGRRRP